MSQVPEASQECECDDFRIGIVAVGGAAISVLSHVKPDFPFPNRSIAIDLNPLALKRSNADQVILVGNGQLNPKRCDRVRFLAKAAEAQIRQAAEGLHFVFLLCGLGGMAGTHITPFIADVLRRMEIPASAAVIMPFAFEAASRHAAARKGLAQVRNRIACVFPLPSDADRENASNTLSLDVAIQQRRNAFAALYGGVCHPLLVNQMPGLDFEDVRVVLSLPGHAAFTHLVIDKDVSLVHAATEVLEKHLKGPTRNSRPKGILMSFKLHPQRHNSNREMGAVMNVVTQLMPEDASIIFGSCPSHLEERTEIVFVFTGLDQA